LNAEKSSDDLPYAAKNDDGNLHEKLAYAAKNDNENLHEKLAYAAIFDYEQNHKTWQFFFTDEENDVFENFLNSNNFKHELRSFVTVHTGKSEEFFGNMYAKIKLN
jgi:hypothetical protein